MSFIYYYPNSALAELMLKKVAIQQDERLTMKILPLLGIACAFTINSLPADANPNHPQKDKTLPPGIEKKYERTGKLPPGWEKKLIVGKRLDHDIYDHGRVIVPMGDDGIITVRIENKVVRLIQATREIVEILD